MDLENISFPNYDPISNAVLPKSDLLSLTDHEEDDSPEQAHNLECYSPKQSDSNSHKNKDLAKLKRQAFKANFAEKAQSFQDLHSDYSKKRYRHVKSKVKEYIENLKSQDRQSSNKITRYRSFPETLSGSNHSLLNEDDTNVSMSIEQTNFENIEEIARVKNLNEYLQETLQDKMAQVAKLKRCCDSMRIELQQIKDKDKEKHKLNKNHFKQYYSVDNDKQLYSSLSKQTSPKVSKETQTNDYNTASNGNDQYENITEIDFFESNNNSKCEAIFENHNPLEYQSKQQLLKHDAVMNVNCLGSDSAIELEDEKEINEIVNEHTKKTIRKNKKKRKFANKGKWKTIFGTFTIGVPCCGTSDSFTEDYFYKRIPSTEN